MTEPMTRERERELIALAQGGDESAQEEMIRQWLPFVHGQLSRWSTFSARVDRDDLIAVGMAAIFRITMKFDLDSDNGFGAYACTAICHRPGS
jgi:DNA-directed RNA polymerase specialized sigma subunit